MEEVIGSLAIIADRLRNSEIFNDLDDKDLLAIAEYCQEESYQDGQTVFIEGEPAEKLAYRRRQDFGVLRE